MSSVVSVTVKRMEIPTYVLGPDSPYPPLQLRWEHGFYPYSSQLDIRTEKRPVEHRVVVLENDYVRAIVLPDMGGRLYSLFDKVAGHDTFMVPPSVKYQNISMRGAWIAGGIEWNFGHRGHNVSTVNPVSWAVRRDSDGSASVWVGAIVRPLESRWAVRMILKPDRSALDLDIVTMAPLILPGMMYWWTNSAVEVSMQSKFFYFGTYAGDWQPHSWPMLDGADFSWYRNRTFGADMFLMEPQRDYLGFYDFDRHHGLAQTADRFLAPGQKYFTWGSDERGRFWDLLLSDYEQPYCEIQRGRLPSQGVTEPIPPMSCDGWRETWAPINKTEGFSGIENDLVISVNPEGETASIIRLLSLVPRKKVKVEAFAGADCLDTWAVDALQPGVPAEHRLNLKKGQKVLRVKVTAADGSPVMDWREFEFKDEDWTSYKNGFDADKASIEELFDHAERRRFDWWPYYLDDAVAMHEKILKKDPGHCGALRALAEIDFFAGRFDKAEERVREALKRRPAEPGLLLLLGWTLMYQDKPDQAVESFINAGRYEANRRNGMVGAISAHLKSGRNLEADRIATGLHAAFPKDKWARLMKVTTARKLGRTSEAVEVLKDLLADDPLWSRATAEALLLGVDPGLADGQRKLADDSVTAAVPYLELGLWDDAKVILGQDESDEKFSPAVRLSHLAWALHKLGDKAGARVALKRAAAATMQIAHPWSTASLVVLGGLTAAYPDEPALHLMYGNILASRNRIEDARAEWTRALKAGLEHTIVYRNLAATAAHEGRKKEALEYYRKAWALADKDLNMFTEFDRFLATQGLHKERLKLYGQLPADARDRSMVALRRVPQLLDTENYDDALEELSVRTFLAGEGQERISRIYFHEALLGKGVELMNEGRWDDATEILKQGLTYPRNHNVGRQSASPGESMINYMLGLAAEAAGRPQEAKEYWLKAACEPHSEGELTQAYEMLAWLALDNRTRAMGLAHEFERYGRGEKSPPSWFFWHNPKSVLTVGHALGQLAKGRPHEAQGMFKKVVADEPDARWVRPHANMSLDVLQRMCRKVTGAATPVPGSGRNRLKEAAADAEAGNGDGQAASKRAARGKGRAK
jgi:tetratricopeptide (TPR) repeat protein